MQPNSYAYYPYGYNPYAAGAQMPVRYAIPPGQRQASPRFANQSYDRYATMPAATRPPPSMAQPMRYPPGYRPGYPQPSVPTSPAGGTPRPQQPEQLQPPRPYYYNPYGANPEGPPGPRAPAPKKGAKEFKDSAFTIAPDGAHADSIKGLVSNNDINELLKHKGTKVKVSKIYRITKTKPEIIKDSSSDEDLPPLPRFRQPPPPPSQQHPPPPSQQPQPPQSVQRPVSSSSSDSHCSTCSNCSCHDCRSRKRSHTYDDCPDCRAELNREHARGQRRK